MRYASAYDYDSYLGSSRSAQVLWAVAEAVVYNMDAVKGTYCKSVDGHVYIREGSQWIRAITLMDGNKEYVRGPNQDWIPVPNKDHGDLLAKIQKLAIQRISRPQDVK